MKKLIGNTRANFLDYHKPGLFMITMNKERQVPIFSSIIEEDNENKSGVYVITTDLGNIIREYLENIEKVCVHLEVWNYIIMPDHIHFLIYIKRKMDLTLGEYLAKFKKLINDEAKAKGLLTESQLRVFELGFNDLFVSKKIRINTIKRYIQNNPYWLWLRHKHPEYFEKIYNINLLDVKCSFYGNISLLDNPFKFPVVVHRADTCEQLNQKYELWRYAIKNGGVLCGAFISKKEKAIRDEIFMNGSKMILILSYSFDKREKPKGKLLDMCENGQLLIISPEFPFPRNEDSFRKECVFMNNFAEKLCKEEIDLKY